MAADFEERFTCLLHNVHSLGVRASAVAARFKIINGFNEMAMGFTQITELPLQVADRNVNFRQIDCKCNLLGSQNEVRNDYFVRKTAHLSDLPVRIVRAVFEHT